ncbi:MAG: type II secretion system protein N [Desulfobacteraceae bacterium]|jgi:general secretion pathway protein C
MVDRYFTLVNVILITAFVGLSTGTFYKAATLFIDKGTSAPVPTEVADNLPIEESQPKVITEYEQVAGRNLFKVSDMAISGSNSALSLDELERTELQLTLWGTIAGAGDMAWAIIEDKATRNQGLYKVGDTVQNATLTHVFRNKVVLNLNGKDQILETVEGDSAGGGGTAGPMSSGEPGSGKITVDKNTINESLKDVNSLMKDVRIRPHFSNGQSDGLIVSGIRGDSTFKKLGLRNGDIIMGVDGSKIESVDDAMKLYSGLKNMQNMKIEIKRRGQVQTLDYNVK